MSVSCSLVVTLVMEWEAGQNVVRVKTGKSWGVVKQLSCMLLWCGYTTVRAYILTLMGMWRFPVFGDYEQKG